MFFLVVRFESPTLEIMTSPMERIRSKNLSGIILPLNCLVFSEYSFQLRQLQPAHPLKGRQERTDPLIISQYPVYDAPAASNDLHRDSDQPIEKPTKLHDQELIPMLPFAYQQSEPCFQSPSQSGHHHIGPVGYQIIYRHPQSIETILELLNEVFLIAPFIAEPNDFGRTQVRSVGDVEKIPNIVPQPHLPLLHRKALSHHDDSIGAFTLGRLIAQLCNIFAHQMDIP